MALPFCIASLDSVSGSMHFYTIEALQAALEMMPIAGNVYGQASVDSLLLDGFNIQQWAQHAKHKSNIASSICREMES